MTLKSTISHWVEVRAKRLDIEAIYGKDSVTDAYDIAIEAGKLGLRAEDLDRMARSHYMLEALDMPRLESDTTISWAVRHGIWTNEELDAAKAFDLLGINDDGAAS